MLIRAFQVGDEPHLHQVFLSAIHGIANRDYTPEQLNAWAPEYVDPVLWADRMRGIAPFVVEDDGKPIAYADIQPSGYIDHFFVSARYARQGVGSKLMRRLHDEAEAKGMRVLTANVSRTAQRFFKHWGFSIIEERQPVVRGVVIPNALMKKELQDLVRTTTK
ncbi:MAG: GNAT family N-acetyltransferase [Steroidobacteraceae bacterium]